MTALEKMVQWLKTFPLWEDDLHIDDLGAAPSNTGLYPGGLEEVSRREDVLGNVTVVCRLHFLLYRRTARQQDNGESSRWLLQLQDWVQKQSAAGLAPRLGDIPEKEQIRAEQGRLSAPNQTGTKRYAVKLTAEYDVIIDN